MTNNVKKMNSKPRVAVIGAGIFGVNIAIDLADFAEVTLYEQNTDILKGGSFINQFRHHMGYHYPRSNETVIDIQQSASLFEERYGKALVEDTPTFYALAKEGSQVNAEEFIDFCDRHKLQYSKEKPPTGYINEELVDLIIRVPEPSYHYDTIHSIAYNLLNTKKDEINLRLNTKVVNCVVGDKNKKIISSISLIDNVVNEEEYDFVVNATYAHLNDFTKWLNLPPFPVRVDLAEVLILKLSGPKYSLTVMDGPFATIMPTGNQDEYTLYHARESILDRYTPEDGLVKFVNNPISQSRKIYKESLTLFPFLEKAQIVESRIIHRGVLANHEHDDARVADIVIHGYGCWSVLSGKILSSVKTSQRVSSFIIDSLKKD